MSEVDPFTGKRMTLFVVLAVLPAVLVIGGYLLHRQRHSHDIDHRLTPAGVRLIKQADGVVAYHLAGDHSSTSTAPRLAGFPISEQKPRLDAYYAMRLRKALFGVENTSDNRPPCTGPPQLAYEFSDSRSTVTIFLSLVCQSLHAVETDESGRAVSEGRASLSAKGVDQFRFLDSEAFQPALK